MFRGATPTGDVRFPKSLHSYRPKERYHTPFVGTEEQQDEGLSRQSSEGASVKYQGRHAHPRFSTNVKWNE
jgi:hypothetical protein